MRMTFDSVGACINAAVTFRLSVAGIAFLPSPAFIFPTLFTSNTPKVRQTFYPRET